ncbi:DNA repair protein REV1 isoform X2 [Tripterygium wilfordii]|uniref:DNA repair protein REV1 isoform X2 n=1 Tax=Tripterygium wilfordii TaxID=458696 RepID=UPI0018F8519F|nr:DNA repair protein REV1 isoform X2 [Tripterygium wilfordii]
MSSDASRSVNSGQKSKRSFNSNSSSHNSNVSNRKRNKKSSSQNQKTLGMAWGANSLSSSRVSSFRSSPFSDFGSYMVEKNRKLQNQFDAEASTSSRSGSSSEKPIFHGVSIFVDGFTVPSSQELRGYMLKHGGRFENYFSRHRVTHIICSNLPDSKIKNLRSFSCGLPVVKPSWILESVAANKVLNWLPFQLDQISDDQPKLSDFFVPKSCLMSRDASNHTFCHTNLDVEDSSVKGGTLKDSNLHDGGESTEHTRWISTESICPVHDNAIVTMNMNPSGGNRKSCEGNISDFSYCVAEDETSVKSNIQSSSCQPSASVSHCCSDNEAAKGSISSRILDPSNQRHSTTGDPNFVENYFKNSRLHFIGTWRHRYRKRFPSLTNGVKCASSEAGTSHSWKNATIHIDMDCFFVSVVIRNRPELQNKPVAICHSNNPKGTAEISSANYPARSYGVRAGMFVRDAKALCPQLVIFPYNFEAYEEVADRFYDILHKYCNKVQAVSCDEAFLDLTDLKVEDPEFLASAIRKEIFETTGCTASAGIAGNMLMARLATRVAKPNGQCYIPPERVDEHLHQLPVEALPGIGHVLQEKLKQRNVSTCGQLRMISKDSLKKDFGTKTGEMLWNYCRGVDNRTVGVIQESKSIGAEVNWGVRFKNLKDSQHFLLNLCKEVSLRLQGCGVQGRTLTLKMKKRRKDAEEPSKYMGCGDCENLSHSITLPEAVDDVEVLQRITKQLFGSFHIDVKDIRGIGLQVTKLESIETSRQGFERNSLKSWLISGSGCKEVATKERVDIDCEKALERRMNGTLGRLSTDQIGTSAEIENNSSNDGDCLNQLSALPPLSHLDIGVIGTLPPELFSELNEVYSGKLVDFIAKNKGKGKEVSNSLCPLPHEGVEGLRSKGEGPSFSDLLPSRQISLDDKQCKVEELPRVPVSGSYNEAISTIHLGKFDLLPSSLSQVDATVLQELPEEFKVDLLRMLPAHRRQEQISDAALCPLTGNCEEPLSIGLTESPSEPIDFILTNDLWIGHPPLWVDKFKFSNCSVLNTLAEVYYKSGSNGTLSLVLQRTISESFHLPDASSEGWHDAIYSLCELMKQYIKLKTESDIEEIYICFRLLKRLTKNSSFFSRVYDTVFPYLQAFVSEFYGGNLHI